MFDLPMLENAARLVHAVFPPTPSLAWPLLAARTGAEVWVKHENHTPTGAFKVRGGLTYMDQLRRDGRGARGIVSATRGNHGQSLAFGGARHGVPVTIVVPRGNSHEKNVAMHALGATLLEHGQDFDAARAEAARLAAARGLEFPPSFAPALVLGVATYALELFRAAPPLDALYVPIGLGSGICGCIMVRDLLGLATEIIGVQSTAAPAYALSFAAGRPITTDSADTLADGMAVRTPDPVALGIIRRGARRIVTVTDAEVAAAIRAYWQDTHNLAEGAGAAPLAALLQERVAMAERRVGLVLCGGNIDLDLFRRWVLAPESQAQAGQAEATDRAPSRCDAGGDPAMRIHHLDCGTLRPPGGALMDGFSRGFFGRLTCHCLAIETKADGVVLVDTGFGMRDMLHPWPRLPAMNALMLRPWLDPDRTMIRQLQRLGIAPRDVRHIVMTHLDFDHAGGLVDFPEARVHLMAAEAVAAKRREGMLGRIRWRPTQWGDTSRWHAYPARTSGRWFGFDAVVQLDGLPPEILLVPLPGHSPGHAGVAIETPRGWVLHAADSYFNRAEVHGTSAPVPPGAAAYEYLMAWDSRLGRANQARVRALVRDPEAAVAVFCTHDPVEFVAMSLWSGRAELQSDDPAAPTANAA